MTKEDIIVKKDFEFIINLIDEFTSQKRIKDSLNVIEKENINGWEIWWQIEFAAFLSKHDKISSWEREKSLPVDGRTSWAKKNMFVDFYIKQKYSKKDTYIALELKQNKSMKQCITKMLRDINKVNSLKQSYNNLRSFWNIGIHRLTNKEKSKKYLNEISDRLYRNCNYYTQHIKKTNFAFTIF